MANFRTETKLNKHRATNTICNKYKNIYFTCRLCNFTTLGMKNIMSHECITSAEGFETIETIDNQMEALKNDLRDEQAKNAILIQFISEHISKHGSQPTIQENAFDPAQQLTTHQPTRIQTETPNTQHLQNQICNIDDDCDEEEEEEEYNKEKNPFKSYKSFRSSCIELIDERPPSIDLNVDEREYQIKQGYISLDEAKRQFDVERESMIKRQTYVTISKNIKNIRRNVFCSLSIDEYKKLLETQNEMITRILKNKGHQDKKIETILFNSMNSIDRRLMFFGKYHDTPLDMATDYCSLKSSIEIHNGCSKGLIPYNNDVINKFYNYGTVILPIQKCLEIYLLNKYGFNNIIYVPIKQSSDSDRYSFYLLDERIKTKRYWRMDNRLMNLTDLLVSGLKQYLIEVFRKMYIDVFHDNEYRSNYLDLTTISIDISQLFQNIMLVSNPSKLRNALQTIIVDKSTYYPSENDKVNLYGDDPVVRSRAKTVDDGSLDTIKLLFDNISDEFASEVHNTV